MHFTCTRAAFSRALTLVNHAVAKGTAAMPLLTYMRLEVEAGHQRLKLQATNLEISVTAWAAIEEVDEAGVIALPARLLTELLSTLEEGKITFHIDLESWKARLTHSAGQATFMGLSAQEYPRLPEAQEMGLQIGRAHV